MDIPGGIIKPFCEPVTARSTPHACCSNGIDASEDTASTNNSASEPTSSITRRTPAMSEVTPVAVSLWQAKTPVMVLSSLRWRA
jgi:hypothetical protein